MPHLRRAALWLSLGLLFCAPSLAAATPAAPPPIPGGFYNNGQLMGGMVEIIGYDSITGLPCHPTLGGTCGTGSSSGGSVTAASGAFVDCAITTIGCEADTPWSGTGSATLVAAIKAMTLASQGPGVAQTAKGVDLGAVESVQVIPAAGTASSITTGGTAVTLVTCPCLGGFITNPPNLASQGIAGAENFYVDMVGTPGSTDANGNGTTVILQAGQTFYIPAAPTGVVIKGNAATSGHKVSIEKW